MKAIKRHVRETADKYGVEITEYRQTQNEQSPKTQGGSGKTTGFFISGTTVSLQLLNLYNGCLREKEGKEAEGG